MINSGEISVVVQGPINKTETKKCLKSIRKFLPKAQIILSTWKNSDTTNLDYDILVLSDDPGAVLAKKNSIAYNNLNRQLLTTQEGLKKASRKYVLKLRSDLILTSDKFLDYFDKFQSRGENYCLFKRKVLTSTLYTRFNVKCHSIKKRMLLPFHVSDWWFFGLKEDIDTYFLDTKMVQEPEFSQYFNLEQNKNKITPYGKVSFKFAPEQYLTYSCFNRNFSDIYMEDAADINDEIMEKSRQSLINNFIVLEFKQSGIYLNKYFFSKNEILSGDQYVGLYNFYRFENEYKKYCDKNYEITTKENLFENESLGYSKLRIYKHIAKLSDKNVPLLNKFEHFFVGLPISIVSHIINLLKEKSSKNK